MTALDAIHYRPASAYAGNSYVCESCGETFESDWSHDDAEAEMREQWGDLPHDERSIICDDCYHKFMAWMAARQ